MDDDPRQSPRARLVLSPAYLGALGGARSRGRAGGGRADLMIESVVDELTAVVDTKSACQAVCDSHIARADSEGYATRADGQWAISRFRLRSRGLGHGDGRARPRAEGQRRPTRLAEPGPPAVSRRSRREANVGRVRIRRRA